MERRPLRAPGPGFDGGRSGRRSTRWQNCLVILIPIGRDDAEIRRHAWVSYTIIALNVLMFVAIETASRPSKVMGIQRGLNEAGDYLIAHPYLKIPPELEPMIDEKGRTWLAERARGADYIPPAKVVAAEQRTLNDLARKAMEGMSSLPYRRWGYVPAEGGFLRLMTSMFVHAGLLHLLGNLLFFFLSGPFIEDVFGRPLFAALYVTGGIAASMTYYVKHPDGTVPLVGASGAIAAVMGAYLVRFLRSKVEFLFVPFILRPHWHFRFFLPAFVVLPLWFIQQWVEMSSEAGGGGVAFSAHVGGFVYGLAFAIVVKVIGFEEKYVNPVVEQETTWTMDERTLRAMGALRDAQAIEDPVAIDAAATQLLARYSEEKQKDLALELIQEVTIDQRARLPKFLPRAAAYVERSGDREWALDLYRRVFESDPEGANAVPSLVKMGTLLRGAGDVKAARETFAKARAHPACTAEWAPAIDAKIEQLST